MRIPCPFVISLLLGAASLAVGVLPVAGCATAAVAADDDGAGSDGDSDGDADTDSDGDVDSDTDTDTDGDSGTGDDCGDGETTGDEQCDEVVETVDCDTDCTFAECGDELINTTAGEECDDGNEEAGDGCEDCLCAAVQEVVDIPFSATTGWLSTGCCDETNYRVANDVGDTLVASFEDALPTDTIPTTIEIQFGIRHACNSTADAMEFRFNDQYLGGWSSADGPHCDCSNSTIGTATFAAEPLDYLFDATNTVSIVHNATGNCHEAIATVPTAAAGTAVRITLAFAADGCDEE